MMAGRRFRRLLGLAGLALALLPAGTALADCKIGVIADLPVTMRGLRASVPVKVNGKDTSFWLDSGAFFSIMSKAKAVELGVSLSAAPPGFYLIGIGGNASAEIGTAKTFGIVGQELKNLQFLVGGSDAGNGLIGRNILALADTEFDLANGSVKLFKATGCDKLAMAYWANGKSWFTVPMIADPDPRDRRFRLPVMINGVKIQAEYDSGAPTSLLSRKAAEKAGIDLKGPGVTESDGVMGFGRRRERGWVAPVASIAIGDEEILKSRIEVIDNSIGGGGNAPDMLLGADYMLAHHIYVARSQRTIYFTYSGGKAFITDPLPPDAAGAAPAPFVLPAGKTRVEALTGTAAQPVTAEEFVRRGNGRMTAQKYDEAIADFSEAIRLAPAMAAYYRDRAQAYAATGKMDLGMVDMDRALALDPNDGALLVSRGYIRFGRKDRAGAQADADAAVRALPPSSLGVLPLANLFEQLGQPARAIPLYDGVIATHRNDAKLGAMLNGRCWVRALANIDLDKALADCNGAIKRNGALPQILDSRALVQFRRGDRIAALADYNAALAANPRIAWSLYMRGLTRIALGQMEAGKADQKAATDIDSDIAERAITYDIKP